MMGKAYQARSVTVQTMPEKELSQKVSSQTRLAGDAVGGDNEVANIVVAGLDVLQMQAPPAQTRMMGLPQGSERA